MSFSEVYRFFYQYGNILIITGVENVEEAVKIAKEERYISKYGQMVRFMSMSTDMSINPLLLSENFTDIDGHTGQPHLYLIRCPVCGLENYGPNVNTGCCFWCNYDGNLFLKASTKTP